MTKEECTIITAFTGVSMLQGKDINLLYKYAEERLGYPVMTHDMANEKFWKDLKHEAENDFFDLCMNASISDMKELSSAQPEDKCSECDAWNQYKNYPRPHWIPCSEKLPEEEYVLISKKPSKISGSKWCVTIAIRMADPRSGKVNWRDIGFGVIPDDNVLAWMPRPKPWKEKRSEA